MFYEISGIGRPLSPGDFWVSTGNLFKIMTNRRNDRIIWRYFSGMPTITYEFHCGRMIPQPGVCIRKCINIVDKTQFRFVGFPSGQGGKASLERSDVREGTAKRTRLKHAYHAEDKTPIIRIKGMRHLIDTNSLKVRNRIDNLVQNSFRLTNRSAKLMALNLRTEQSKKTFDALEWLAAMPAEAKPSVDWCSHVPNKREQMVLYYGYCN